MGYCMFLSLWVLANNRLLYRDNSHSDQNQIQVLYCDMEKFNGYCTFFKHDAKGL